MLGKSRQGLGERQAFAQAAEQLLEHAARLGLRRLFGERLDRLDEVQARVDQGEHFDGEESRGKTRATRGEAEEPGKSRPQRQYSEALAGGQFLRKQSVGRAKLERHDFAAAVDGLDEIIHEAELSLIVISTLQEIALRKKGSSFFIWTIDAANVRVLGFDAKHRRKNNPLNQISEVVREKNGVSALNRTLKSAPPIISYRERGTFRCAFRFASR